MNFKDIKWFKNFILSIIIITLLTSIFVVNLKNYYKNNFYNNNKLWLIKVNNQIIEINQIQKIFEYKMLLLEKKSINKTYDLLTNKIYIKNLYKKILSNLINKCLIKNYIEKNNIKNNKKNIKNLIMKMDIFQKNKKFNSNLYYQFLKTNNIDENEYLKIIGNKITEKFLFNDMINSNNLFKNEKIFLNKLNQERILCKKYTINFKKIYSQQKCTDAEISNFYNTYKKNFINKKKFKIKFFKIIPFLKLNQKIKKSDILKKFQKNKKKYSTNQIKKISFMICNTQKEARKKIQKFQNNKEIKFKCKKIFIDNYNSIKNFNLNWINKKKFIKIIKKIHLHNIHEISKIIKFKNKFLIFKLDNIHKFKNKNIDKIKNFIKKKIKKKIKKNNYQQLITKINLISINNNKYFHLLENIIHKKPKKTNWFTIDSIPKDIKCHNIKNFFKHQKNLIIHNKKKFINYRFFNKDKNIFIKIIDLHKNTIKPLLEVKNKISNLIKLNKSKIQAFKKIKEITENLNQKSCNNLIQKNILFNKKKYFIQNKNKYSLILINKFNKNFVQKKPLYINLTNYKNKWIILKFYKKYFIKINHNETNKNYLRYKIKNQKLLIKLILESLRSQAQIQYNINTY
jgi:peptidyl-prolyl cis-trans isomerase D